MSIKAISKDILPPKGYKEGFNEYNQNYGDPEELYGNVEDF